MSSGTKAIMANITGGKIMKVRWNACYAASNILRKEEEEGQWRTDLINCLLDMVINFHNFKVINAQYERAIHGGSIVGYQSDQTSFTKCNKIISNCVLIHRKIF
jgi:hypothetical protein